MNLSPRRENLGDGKTTPTTPSSPVKARAALYNNNYARSSTSHTNTSPTKQNASVVARAWKVTAPAPASPPLSAPVADTKSGSATTTTSTGRDVTHPVRPRNGPSGGGADNNPNNNETTPMLSWSPRAVKGSHLSRRPRSQSLLNPGVLEDLDRLIDHVDDNKDNTLANCSSPIQKLAQRFGGQAHEYRNKIATTTTTRRSSTTTKTTTTATWAKATAGQRKDHGGGSAEATMATMPLALPFLPTDPDEPARVQTSLDNTTDTTDAPPMSFSSLAAAIHPLPPLEIGADHEHENDKGTSTKVKNQKTKKKKKKVSKHTKQVKAGATGGRPGRDYWDFGKKYKNYTPPPRTPETHQAAIQLQRLMRGWFTRLQYRIRYIQDQLDRADELTEQALEKVRQETDKKKSAYMKQVTSKQVEATRQYLELMDQANKGQEVMRLLEKQNQQLKDTNTRLYAEALGMNLRNQEQARIHKRTRENIQELRQHVVRFQETHHRLRAALSRYEEGVAILSRAEEAQKELFLTEQKIKVSFMQCVTNLVNLVRDQCGDRVIVLEVLDIGCRVEDPQIDVDDDDNSSVSDLSDHSY